MEAQFSQKAMLESLKETKDFDRIKTSKWRSDQMQSRNKNSMKSTRQNARKFRYCGSLSMLRHCPAWGETCSNCGKGNHFKSVYRSTPETGRPLAQNRPICKI